MRPVFLHIPRSGGQSIRAALGLEEREIHLTATERGRRGELAGSLPFTFVRDPWERAVSTYRFLWRHRLGEVTPAGFRAWVAGGMLHPCGRPPTLYAGTRYSIDVTAPQVEWLRGARLGFIGRFERLAEDFADLCRVLGVETELPHLNAAPEVDIEAFYDSSTLRQIGELYREDVTTLGYTGRGP